ncbi:MAG TPA: hypothetical protein V6D47_19015 [Oscillatoriaceae cyanobacterium]
MKQWVIAGAIAGSLALGGSALAQTPAQQPSSTGQTSEQAPAPKASKAKKPAMHSSAGATDDQAGAHKEPKQQPNTTENAEVSDSAMTLGTVHIPKAVKADNKPLAAGTYQVRLTADEAKPDAVGTSGKLERWVEFVQHGEVKGREVVSIVPKDETKMVQKDTPPAPGTSKVQMLKGGDYLRVWINKAGTQYLIYLVP